MWVVRMRIGIATSDRLNSRTGASPRVGTVANMAALSAVQPGCLRISATMAADALGTLNSSRTGASPRVGTVANVAL